jgi:hypothetical protein
VNVWLNARGTQTASVAAKTMRTIVEPMLMTNSFRDRFELEASITSIFVFVKCYERLQHQKVWRALA